MSRLTLKACENTGKRDKPTFSLCPTMLLNPSKVDLNFGVAFILSFANALNFKVINPFPKRQILDSFTLKEFADDNFRFDENGRRFSKRVENTVGKGEIACHEQFLLFPQ